MPTHSTPSPVKVMSPQKSYILLLLLLVLWTFLSTTSARDRYYDDDYGASRSSSSSSNDNRAEERTKQVTLTGRKYRVQPSRSTNQQSTRASYSQQQSGSRGYPGSRPERFETNGGSESSYYIGRGQGQPPSSQNIPFGRSGSQRSRLPPLRRSGPRSSKPNIIVIMTDDQDVLLGSLKYMPKLKRFMTDEGVLFNNSFVSTPMCCPSRSSFLTGLYVHNHDVYTNNDNCSSMAWRKKHESRSFATYINETYDTGYFGKYLNEYDGNHIPVGWRRWVGLIRNTRFYNYSVVDERGVKTEHYDNYYKDYLTDLVANDSVAFMHESRSRNPDKPFMMMLSLPAPHGPEDAAPQYQHMFVNNTDHRTPAWNYAPNEDKQWLLQNTYPMMPQYKMFTDLLQRRRLQTLQSVDDLVEKVVTELKMLGELDNTYIMYTSDHGYHLGQYGLIKGKALPFDFDVRVPLIIRGPGIRPGSVISNIVNNIDLAPTIIDIAGEEIPYHMDGHSFLPLIKASKDKSSVDENGFVTLKRPWKDTVLLERGKLSEKIMKQRMRTEELNYYATGTKQGNYFFGSPKMRKLYKECANEGNRLPCKENQKWYCIEDNGRLRKHKCRHNKQASENSLTQQLQKDQPAATPMLHPCPCNKFARVTKLGRKERKKQRRALKQAHKLHRMRRKRSVQDGFSLNAEGELVPFNMFEPRMDVRCRILTNDTVMCDKDIYHKPLELKHHKETIDDMIKEYRQALDDLRDIRRHLRNQRPLIEEDSVDDDDDLTDDIENDCDCDDNGNIIEIGSRRKNKNRDAVKARRKNKRRLRKRKRNLSDCRNQNMNCFTHDNDHWKTPPFWHYGPFCFCPNANNNTYWCLRTVNQTHDFLYCEFITLFMSYYDMKKDPHQLRNIVTEINYGVLQQLHDELNRMKHCKGPLDCKLYGSQKHHFSIHEDWEGLSHLRKQTKSRRKYHDDLEDEEDFTDDDYEDWEDDDFNFEEAPDYE